MSDCGPGEYAEYEQLLDEVTDTQSTPAAQSKYEQLLADLMVDGAASINGYDFKLEWP